MITITLTEDGQVKLKLQLSLKDSSKPSIESISLRIMEDDGAGGYFPHPLYGGDYHEFEVSYAPTKEQIEAKQFKVRILVSFSYNAGMIEKSLSFDVNVTLNSQAFRRIKNPYRTYAVGKPVNDSSMFFGREQLIDELSSRLLEDTPGQCLVLYGQKRSGKTSVVKQLGTKLETDKTLYIEVSMGELQDSRGKLWWSFAQALVRKVENKLEMLGIPIPSPHKWQALSKDTMTAIGVIQAVDDIIQRGLSRQIILSVDEFTYIYEEHKTEARSFMQGWKALLETTQFNAVVVGQDTMLRFIKAYATEFAVTHKHRLSYLTAEESFRLANEPILYNGGSRYRGTAFARLYELTAGSPYFLQKACSQLVEHMNQQKSEFITRADIDRIEMMLTQGELNDIFDLLVVAAGKDFDLAPRDAMWKVLRVIADKSLETGWCQVEQLKTLEKIDVILDDFKNRNVIEIRGELVRIKVLLFASWIRSHTHVFSPA